MGIFDNFIKKNTSSSLSDSTTDSRVIKEGNSIIIDDEIKITFGSAYVGDSTGSDETDFYVYEWFIKESGEIFYVGKGRGDRYKKYHEHAYEAEKIRELFDTDVRFVAKNLTEEQALEIETKELTRVMNETNDILTNRHVPYFCRRYNGYSRGPSTPPFRFESAPVLYASEIEEHYYNTKYRAFDEVKFETLSNPSFIDKVISSEEIEIIYGGNYEKYYKEVVNLLELNGSKIVKSKYAKSVTAWIYPGDDYVRNYDIDEKNAEERIGRRIPAYHLIDVWKLLNDRSDGLVKVEQPEVEINPIHNRVPLSQIKNKNNWNKGFKDGFKYWEEGENERKAGNLEKAIELFDTARYNGYYAPALYESYGKAYRKLKDYDNEIAIIDEEIERYIADSGSTSQYTLKLEEQKKKAIEKKRKLENAN